VGEAVFGDEVLGHDEEELGPDFTDGVDTKVPGSVGRRRGEMKERERESGELDWDKGYREGTRRRKRRRQTGQGSCRSKG
jgi:hypothetical protein